MLSSAYASSTSQEAGKERRERWLLGVASLLVGLVLWEVAGRVVIASRGAPFPLPWPLAVRSVRLVVGARLLDDS